jgi:hypothetical protein
VNLERDKFFGWPRRPIERACHSHSSGACMPGVEHTPGPGLLLRGAGRRAHRLSMVECASSPNVYGRYMLPGAWRCCCRRRNTWQAGGGADCRLVGLLGRAYIRNRPGVSIQMEKAAKRTGLCAITSSFQTGAAAPPLRGAGLDRDTGGSKVLDSRRAMCRPFPALDARLSRGTSKPQSKR